MKCKYCGKKHNNMDIGRCHEAACKKNPTNESKTDFELYKQAQQYRFRKERIGHHSGKARKENFVDLIASKIECKGRALTVGCADPQEIVLLRHVGFEKVVGIDLNPHFDEIIGLDMHLIGEAFEKDYFDLIVFSHSLEHAYDFKKVISGAFKVLKSGGSVAIEIPVNYKTNDVDRIDFLESDKLLNYIINSFPGCDISTLFQKNIPRGDGGNFCGTDIARLIMKVTK